MSRFTLSAVLAALFIFWAVPAFCEGPTLWQDPQTGQLFTQPADGRVPVDAEKDLNLPASTVNNLYQDSNGAVYTTPAEGRTKIAVEAAPSTTTPQASAAPAGDYSSQAFKDAVKNVIGEQQSNTYPRVKLGGLFYGEYSYDFDNKKLVSDGDKGGKKLGHPNAFSLNRGYLNVFADMSPEIGARFTSDITRFSGASGTGVTDANKGDWELRVKYAYVDFHNFLNIYPSFEVKMGQFQTAWLDYEEGLWEYRVLDPMIIEKEGFFNSADLGVCFKGKIPAGFGDWQVEAINGEGYHAAETNKYKTVQGRLTLTPLPMNDWTKGLNLTGFASYGQDDKFHKRYRYIAFAGYKYKDDFFVGGEYDWTRGKDPLLTSSATGLGPEGQQNVEGHGWSALAWTRMPFWKPIRVLGRYDWFTHDDNLSDSTLRRWYAGVSYDVSKNVLLVLDNERTLTDKNLKAKAANENLLKVDVQWQF